MQPLDPSRPARGREHLHPPRDGRRGRPARCCFTRPRRRQRWRARRTGPRQAHRGPARRALLDHLRADRELAGDHPGPPDDSFEDRATTVGRPLPQTEVRIVDPVSGETVASGVVGELCTRGYLVMNGYYEMPDETAEAIDADGWLHTGDLASMDERGHCRIEGRLKDMIIRGGENIFPREIEQGCSPTRRRRRRRRGIPDQKWGEQVVRFRPPLARHDARHRGARRLRAARSSRRTRRRATGCARGVPA